MDPRIATTSATLWPLHISARPVRFTKQGDSHVVAIGVGAYHR